MVYLAILCACLLMIPVTLRLTRASDGRRARGGRGIRWRGIDWNRDAAGGDDDDDDDEEEDEG